jgi:hypothetical protein
MNRTRIVVGLAGSFGVSIVVACGSSSKTGNGDESGDSGSGGSSSSGGGASSGGASSGTGLSGCNAGETLCLGVLGNSCVDAGSACPILTTTVLADECSATSPCSGGLVCCSAYVGPDGGAIGIPSADAGVAATDAAAATTGLAGLAVAVQCLSACPPNTYSSQVCVLEADGGSPTTCPTGTTCQNYPLALSSMIPSTLCLAPVVIPDGGYPYNAPDSGTGGTPEAGSMSTPEAGSISDAGSTSDATPE